AAISIVAPSYEVGGGNYQKYLLTPSTPLFQRVYDAVGFFAHAEDATGDLWARIPCDLKQAASEGNFSYLGGDSLEFLHTWGGSTFNDTRLGLDWTMTLPLTLPWYVSPSAPVIRGATSVTAQPYTMARYRINIDPEVIGDYPLLHI